MLSVSHALLWRVSIVLVCYKVRAIRIDLKISVLLRLVFMLDHYFSDGSFLCEIELIDSALEQVFIDIVERNNDLRADGFQGWLFIRWSSVHSLS